MMVPSRGRNVLILAFAWWFVYAVGGAATRGRALDLFMRDRGGLPGLTPWSLGLMAVGGLLLLGLALGGALRTRGALVGGLAFWAGAKLLEILAPTMAGYEAGRILASVALGGIGMVLVVLAVGALPRGQLLLLPFVAILGQIGGAIASWIYNSSTGTSSGLPGGLFGGFAVIGALALAAVARVVPMGEDATRPDREGEAGVLTRLVALAGLAAVASTLVRAPGLRPERVDLFGWGLVRTGEVSALVATTVVPFLVLGGLVLFGAGLGRGLRVSGGLLVAVLAAAWIAPPLRVFLVNAGPGIAAIVTSLAALRGAAGLPATSRLAGALGVFAASVMGSAVGWVFASRVSAGWVTPAFVLVGVGIGALLLWPVRSEARAVAA